MSRLLCVMGSGETTPTMAKLHRELFERVGPQPAVILDTPYGFQSNAADISARTVRYFRESAGRDVAVASLPRAEGAPQLVLESAQARVAEAGWVFSGPGSPTYALRQWRLSAIPGLLAAKLSTQGCIVFSSAAALTLGRWTVPVYEIYKAGADPEWCPGLDLLSPFGLEVAVVPHYDNAEGGTHDTRYCYLGEQRLRYMEVQLPPEAWALGVDEHTACLFDFDQGTASVFGLGTVTLRDHGRELKFPAGTVLAIEELPRLALRAGGNLTGGLAASFEVEPSPLAPLAERPPVSASQRERSPFLTEISRLSTELDEALAARDAQVATEVTLGLEDSLHGWSADTLESDEVDWARAVLRRAVLRLGEAAGPGMRDRREVMRPWVEALLAERDEARRSGRFADADRVRDRLIAEGVEVRDTPSGTEWDLQPGV